MQFTDPSTLVRQLAQDAGFDRCGIAALGPLPRGAYVEQWLRGGNAGTMGYLHRRRDTRLDPTHMLPGARSAIVVAVNYHQRPPERDVANASEEPRGRVAMYAWGEDYHVVMTERLERLVAAMRGEIGVPFDARVCVDTAPIIERELAALAGIGWIGKNTLVMHQSLGSYFFLGEVLTTLELSPDVPIEDHCGRCTRCLDACPTQAFPAPYEMDARRCISYLTIEHRAEIGAELHAPMGDWVFGCDICQQVCPFNHRAPHTTEPRFAPRGLGASPALAELANWTDEECQSATHGSATDRAKPHMWRRNARIALANHHAARDSTAKKDGALDGAGGGH